MEASKGDRSDRPFQESQIICLEDGDTRLYGEVIQLITSRQMCWLRPICLLVSNIAEDFASENLQSIPLDSVSDLVWPTCLFRPAFDTEVISFLICEENVERSKSANLFGRQHLHQFLQRVWMANRELF